MLAYEEVIRTRDGEGKFLAQLPLLVKRVVESIYFHPRGRVCGRGRLEFDLE